MPNLDDISHDVETSRAHLARSLDALTETVHPTQLAQDASVAATDIGTQLAQKAWGSLRDNPAGGLLVTLGLGLLAKGAEPRPQPAPHPHPTLVDPDDAFDGFDDRVEAADAQLRAQMTGEIEGPVQASKLKAALNTGLDQLPPKARRRVVQAREAAIAAQEKVERQAKAAARKSKTLMHEQPLMVGAVALGLGVLAGTLLPGTRREDQIMGQRRDALMDQARAVLADEMAKIKGNIEDVVGKSTDENVRYLR